MAVWLKGRHSDHLFERGRHSGRIGCRFGVALVLAFGGAGVGYGMQTGSTVD